MAASTLSAPPVEYLPSTSAFPHPGGRLWPSAPTPSTSGPRPRNGPCRNLCRDVADRPTAFARQTRPERWLTRDALLSGKLMS